MNLLEYEAKKILSAASIPVPLSQLVSDANRAEVPNFALPAVVKSQVPTGGRGKLGGVRVVQDEAQLEQAIREIARLEIRGFIPKKLLIEEALDIKHEYYLSLMINRSLDCIELSAHKSGGVDIESHTSQEFLRRVLKPRNIDTVGELVAEYLGLESHVFVLQDLIKKLFDCFIKHDAILLEINPLILTDQNELVAGDCKMVLDDAAAFRHPDWDFEEKATNANFVTLDTDGTVATIANGAGLAMATVDAVKAAGLSPANFLDIGGGATVESIGKTFGQLMEFPNVTAIVINIFGGIVRCDEVARAIIEAKQQFSELPPLYIRLSGTNAKEAAHLLEQNNLSLYGTLEDCLKGVKS